MCSRSSLPGLIRIFLALLLVSSLSPVDGYQTGTPVVTGYQTLDGRQISEAMAGTEIRIVGNNMGTSGKLDFNGRPATPTLWSSTALTVVVPAATLYPANGTVRLTTGGVTVLGPPFTILAPPPPTISGYRTTDGTAITSALPSTAIVIVGTNLGSSGRVRFNGLLATTTSWTPTAVTAIVPTPTSYPYTGRVQLSTGGQLANGPNFTILAPPSVTPTISGYVTPGGSAITSAAPGTTIVITGANLGTTGSASFNGISVTPSSWTSTAITVAVPTAPSYPNAGPIQVTTGGQTAIGPDFTITEPPLSPLPTVTSYRTLDGATITSAPTGAQVVVVGANMGSSGTVSFNGIFASVSTWTATAITVTVPAGAPYPNTGPVRVVTGGNTAIGPNFTILAPPPSISGYRSTGGAALTSAPAGTSVVIVGTNLGSSGRVRFNGLLATTTSWTPTAVTAIVPTPTSYPYTGRVQLSTSGQLANGPNFTILAPTPPSPPVIDGYRNTSGANLSSAPPGTTVVVYGANLGTSGTVRFNGIGATPSTWTPAAITVVVPTPASFPNIGQVQVTTGGQTATGPNFTIIAPPPSISGYQDTSGASLTSAAAGTIIVITGANLGTSGTVRFNGIGATPSNWTPSAITVPVPTAPSYPNTGAVQVTTGGQTVDGPDFTITEPPPTNRPPTVTITSPASGTSFAAPATVTFNATAGDPDGTVQRVEWYLGTTHLETDLAPPYSLTWSSSTPNSYTFTAKAFDNAGASTVSNAVTIQVTGTGQTVFRIMPFGDSITYGTLAGGGTTGGYRVTLWRLLESAGFRIDFVGSLQSGYPFVPDPDNEGRPGWTTQGALNLIQERLLNLLGNLNPDVVLLMLGTNDLLQNLPGAPERLGTIMDEIAQQRPNATTIVAGIIPIRGMEAQVLAYNQAVVSQVTQRQAAGQRLRYVDMYSVVSLSDLPDGVHPNDAGYSNLGNAWYQALVPVLTGG